MTAPAKLDASQGDRSGEPVVKPWSPEAEVVLEMWVSNSRKAVIANAESICEDELILASHVRKATKRFETSTSIYTKRSEWAKWIGFFAWGVFVPNLISLLNAENADKSTIYWTFGACTVAAVLVIYAFVSDSKRSRDD